ncbi:MAG: TetR/AcrR family transcriptional regulator [Bacteroidota bacterium]
MKTKEKILQQALKLFNTKGVNQVSSLEISQVMNISYGNLTYHFKNKEELVLALYKRMQNELNEAINNLVKRVFQETYYLKLVNETFEVTWKYRFVYLDLSSLMLQYETIHEAEKKYALDREKIMTKAKEYLIREGYLKSTSQVDYTLTIRSLSLLLYSWINDARLFYKGEEVNKIDTYVAMFYNIALPNFTKKGMEKYQQLLSQATTGQKTNSLNSH